MSTRDLFHLFEIKLLDLFNSLYSKRVEIFDDHGLCEEFYNNVVANVIGYTSIKGNLGNFFLDNGKLFQHSTSTSLTTSITVSDFPVGAVSVCSKDWNKHIHNILISIIGQNQQSILKTHSIFNDGMIMYIIHEQSPISLREYTKTKSLSYKKSEYEKAYSQILKVVVWLHNTFGFVHGQLSDDSIFVSFVSGNGVYKICASDSSSSKFSTKKSLINDDTLRLDECLKKDVQFWNYLVRAKSELASEGDLLDRLKITRPVELYDELGFEWIDV